MYNHEKTIVGNLDVKRVWEIYSNVDCWKEWDIFIDSVELNGEFKTGTKGVIHMQQVGIIPFTLANVVESEGFEVISHIGEITNVLGYSIVSNSVDGTVTLKDSVTLSGAPDEQLTAIAEQAITPVMMEILERKVSLTKIDK